MAGYIGTIPTPQATQSRDVYTATNNQTTFTTQGYTPDLVSVFLNGVHLARADFTATNGSDVVLAAGAAANDTVEIVAFSTFDTGNSTFTGDVIASGGTLQASGDTAAGDDAAIGYTAAEGLILTGQGSTSDITLKNDADATVFTVPTGTDDILFPDDAKAMFGAGSDLQIYHDGGNSHIKEEGTGILFVSASTQIQLRSAADEVYIQCIENSAVNLFHNNVKKFETSATGITVTGAIATSAGGVALTSLDIDGGTDIGAALVDADLMIVDDGAGGTNRKATMARLATYMGTKVGGGAMVFIASSGALSNAASVQFRAQDGHFDATKFDHYIFKFMYVIPATDGVWPIAQISTNDGGAYDTTNGNYHYGDSADFNGYYLSATYNMGSGTNEYGMCGEMELFGPHLTNYTYADIRTVMTSTSGHVVNQGPTRGTQVHNVAADVDAIKFSFNSGNIESGEIVMYGIANA